MERFAELLDRLVYTAVAQRQAAAHRRLFPRHARSRPRLGAGRPHRRPAARALAKPRACSRELVAPRVDPVLFACRCDYVGDTRRDRGADLARPRPAAACRRRRSPRSSTALLATAPQRCAGARRAAGSTASTPRAAGRCSSSSPAACASASRPASPRRRSPHYRRRRRRRDRGGLARPHPAL